jgi:hypothetical protein
MPKFLLVLLCAFALPLGTARCADETFLKPDGLYQVWFSDGYKNTHPSFDPAATYIVKIDKVNATNPNWVQIEFPQQANQSYTSSMAGKRWINLNFIVEFKAYTPPPGQ